VSGRWVAFFVGGLGLSLPLGAQAQRIASQPEQTPRLIVLHRSVTDAPGYIFVAPNTLAGSQGPEIVDDRSRPVWFDQLPNGDQATDFRVQSYRDAPVLTWWQGKGFGGATAGVDYIADTSYRVIATVHAGNGLDADGHEFALTPQGTALITIEHQIPHDLSPLGGPKDGSVIDGVVQEIDVATGRVLFEWHSVDRVPLDESHRPVASPYDYFHLNAVSVDSDGNLLISSRNTWTVYKVDRRSGQIIWRLGGKRSDFSLGSGVAFAWQHNPLPAGANTIRLFDNGSNGETVVSPRTRVVWIHLDLGTKTATLARELTHPTGISVPSQGNAQGLDNGNTLVGWGELGRVSEFDPQGNLLFDSLFAGQYDTYRAYRFQWSGRPAESPVAAARRSGRRMVVHAIWNGATNVARWRILAGRRVAKLVPVKTVGWNGLDTSLSIDRAARVVEVVALDANGMVSATSKPVRVR
jgi:arylsulfotransferase ASST